MQIRPHIKYLFGAAFLLFIINKFFLRPWVLENVESPFLTAVVYSLPNMSEAIMGTIIVTGITYGLRDFLQFELNDISIYVISTVISSTYVISQELKYHNLGGNNVYDINDVIASVIGLVGTLGVMMFLGFRNNPTSE